MQILKLYGTRSKGKLETIKLIAAVKEDFKAAGVTQTHFYDRV